MSNLVLRDAAEADIPIMAGIVLAAFEEYRGRLTPPSGAHKETPEQLRQKLQTARAVLANLDDNAVGCVFYSDRDDHCYLFRLAVLPAYRRRGVGHALIAHVEAHARAAGLRRVRLGVRTMLHELRARYERLGYLRPVEYGRHEGFEEPTWVVLEKDL